MADDCEIAEEITSRWLAGAIASARVAAPGAKLVPKGRCHWCDEKLPEELEDLVFCPPPEPGVPGCRDDWQAHQDRVKRAGGIRGG